ncbi:hypothetical protein PENTCL1PPCAC_5085, partial [Pristionchus entomophagus]
MCRSYGMSEFRYSHHDLVRPLAQRVSSSAAEQLLREALEALATGAIAFESAVVSRIAKAAVLTRRLALLHALVLLRLARIAAKRGPILEACARKVRTIPPDAVTVPVRICLAQLITGLVIGTRTGGPRQRHDRAENHDEPQEHIDFSLKIGTSMIGANTRSAVGWSRSTLHSAHSIACPTAEGV